MITLKDIKDNFPSEIIIPKEFDDFYYWYLGQKEKKPHTEFLLGFEFDNNIELLKHLFGDKYKDRIGVFASSEDGSLYAFWLDNEGNQKIIFISSDGEYSVVLGNRFIEFLQYLSIGYSYPEMDDFDLTFEQIEKRDKVDYSQMSIDSLKEYEEKHSKPLQTEEGIKELFGEDIDDETLKMLLEINQNAAKKMPEIDTEIFEKAMQEEIEKEQIYIEQLKEYRQWLKTKFQADIPTKGADILNLNDKSFENWAKKNGTQHGE